MHVAPYKTILSPQNNMNIYRGCTHGCIYCDSRSACYQMAHDFEDIEVKTDALAILESAYRQINSIDFLRRTFPERCGLLRRLRRVRVTYPAGWTGQERERYLDQWRRATALTQAAIASCCSSMRSNGSRLSSCAATALAATNAGSTADSS